MKIKIKGNLFEADEIILLDSTGFIGIRDNHCDFIHYGEVVEYSYKNNLFKINCKNVIIIFKDNVLDFFFEE